MPTVRPTGDIICGDERWFRLETLAGAPGQANTEAVVITASDDDKTRLLGGGGTSSPDFVHTNAEKILRGIQNPQVAALLGYKATAVSEAPFRLVKRIPPPALAANSQLSSKPPTDSFIALSYCWHNQDWTAKGGSEPASGSCPNSKIPISSVLFEAILEQRVSGDEGIWIDQWCIDQDNEDEKAIAIGAMDVVYQRARLVAVVLEDITIDEADEAALGALMDAVGLPGGKWADSFRQPQNIQLTRLAWKIFSARWFTRAWCGHELLVSSSNQVFFIRSNCPNRVARLSLEFLYDLAILAKSVSSQVPIAGNEFETLERAHRKQFSRFYAHATYQLHPRWTVAKQDAAEDEESTSSYMRVFSQIFGYDASVVADKLSIVLNVLQCGLYLKGKPSLTAEQCCHVFYHIALAARDPTTLSLCGQRLQREALWMRWPRAADIIEPACTQSRHRRLEQTPAFDDGGIQLDMVLLASSAHHVRRASSDHMTWAQLIIKKCAQCIDEFLFQGSDILDDIIRQPPTEVSLSRVAFHTELLASLHECGIEWLVQSWRLEDPNDFDEEIEQSLRRVMRFASGVDGEPDEAEPTSSDLFCVVGFLDALLGAWLQVEDGVLLCRPAWVQITGHRTSGVLLFVCPNDGEYAIAVPSLLLRSEYRFLKRIWFLVHTSSGAGVNATDGWEVIGKSSSFGAVDLGASAQMAKSMKGPQIICG
jgi:hypothetical protein